MEFDFKRDPWIQRYAGPILMITAFVLVTVGLFLMLHQWEPKPRPCILTCEERGMSYVRTLPPLGGREDGVRCVCDPTLVIVPQSQP